MPSAAPKIVKHGSLSIEVKSFADGRYGFDYSKGGKRVKVRKTTIKQAVLAAEQKLSKGDGGKLNAAGISDSEIAEFLRWKASRKKQITIPELKERFVKSKEGKGKSGYHITRIKNDLTKFAGRFTGYLADLDSAEVEEYLNSIGDDEVKIGPRRWNNILESIVALHRYARTQQLLPAEKTPVELIEKRKATVTILTYTPKEIRALLAVVEPEWVPYIAIGAFAGIRPQELLPMKESGKTVMLTWEDILWDKDKINVPREASKTKQRRFAPLLPNLKKWLDPYRGLTGRIAPVGRVSKVNAEWKRLSGVDWRPDALRHSFASYRLPIIKNMHQLSLEMGNSPAMIFRHYLDLKHDAEAKDYFSSVPKVPKKRGKNIRIVPPKNVLKGDFTEKTRKYAEK